MACGARDPSLRHYLGFLAGEPVATATAFYDEGVAGLYFIFTVPEARRQGIGAAITHMALSAARDDGCRIAVLCSSEMGQSVYRRVGFRDYCTIRLFERPCAPA